MHCKIISLIIVIFASSTFAQSPEISLSVDYYPSFGAAIEAQRFNIPAFTEYGEWGFGGRLQVEYGDWLSEISLTSAEPERRPYFPDRSQFRFYNAFVGYSIKSNTIFGIKWQRNYGSLMVVGYDDVVYLSHALGPALRVNMPIYTSAIRVNLQTNTAFYLWRYLHGEYNIPNEEREELWTHPFSETTWFTEILPLEISQSLALAYKGFPLSVKMGYAAWLDLAFQGENMNILASPQVSLIYRW
ncbi:MAG: hypothetical protein K9N46_09620 [Candidatus Marinimicrobia bacterium]|nr:hypothetical protein [Candidatus Neomarinimicrobiota bacterium]MCF7828423.1 hypothetical protein [Candidatus Neomarinimicrobiota bacterium]MCF7880983.1 hypothetical protein [Candidatus Neomarinimicrobiota bacterium]